MLHDSVLLRVLPTELVVAIFEELSYRELFTCTQVCLHILTLLLNRNSLLHQVCHRFRDLIAGCTSIQYDMYLAIAGMEDNPRNTLSKAEKLPLIKQYYQTWKDIGAETTTFKKDTLRILDGPAWELTGGVLAQSVGTKSVEFRQLPSVARGVAESLWPVELDFNLVDFTMDPGQDLLVTIEAGRKKECVMSIISPRCSFSRRVVQVPCSFCLDEHG